MEILTGMRAVLTVQMPVIPEIRVTTAVITEIILMKIRITDTVMDLTATVTAAITETTAVIRNTNDKTIDQSEADDFVCLTAPGAKNSRVFFCIISIL